MKIALTKGLSFALFNNSVKNVAKANWMLAGLPCVLKKVHALPFETSKALRKGKKKRLVISSLKKVGLRFLNTKKR